VLLEIVAFSALILLFEMPSQIRLPKSSDSIQSSEQGAASPIYDAGPVWPEGYEVAIRETIQAMRLDACQVRLDRIVARCRSSMESNVIIRDADIAYAIPGDTYHLGLHEIVVSDDDWATTRTVWSSLDAMRAAEANPSFKRGAEPRSDPALLDHHLGGEACDLLFALSGNLVDVSIASPCDFSRGDSGIIKVRGREDLLDHSIRKTRFIESEEPDSSPMYLFFPATSNPPVYSRRRDATPLAPRSP
jgi:hypothetical protein